MLHHSSHFARPARLENSKKDYTLVDRDDRGNIVIEFNSWNPSLGAHDTTILKLLPEEAQLMAKMLVRNADSAQKDVAMATALSVG